MQLLDLPVEVLVEIISLCGPGAVTETCRTIADIATSTPSLWTSVHLGPSQCVPEGQEHLHTRLSRAGKSLLNVSILTTGSIWFNPSILQDLCIIISKWNQQIAHLQIIVKGGLNVGKILLHIFQNFCPPIFYALRSLSVRGKDINSGLFVSILGDLDKYFPRLQSLSIPNFTQSSIFPRNATFSHLLTLVLVDDDKMAIDIFKATELLSNTPQLETLWLKHKDQESGIVVENPAQNWEEYEEARGRPLRVFLPHLLRLAVSPGTGTNLLHYLEAPSLQDLHIDGSQQFPMRCRGNICVLITDAMKSFALRSSGLRRLAYTQICFAEGSLEWLWFGNDGRPPFPQLETLAFHDCKICGGTNDPNYALLLRFTQQLMIPLTRLVLLTWWPVFRASSLIPLYQKLIADAPHIKKYELEIYRSSWMMITENDIDALEAIGVRLIWRDNRQAKGDGWWSFDYRLDPSDSCAY